MKKIIRKLAQTFQEESWREGEKKKAERKKKSEKKRRERKKKVREKKEKKKQNSDLFRLNLVVEFGLESVLCTVQ